MKKLFIVTISCLVSLIGYASSLKQTDTKSTASLATGNVQITADSAIIYKNDKGMVTAIFPKSDKPMKFESNTVTSLNQSQLNKYK
ncbi:hypothetical protein [Francisella sp. 19X1-34]|uniref:hypothetical protein n=1 Tax=Francisella sp. 19X1-34 TaxID=3087177 RepID=UPI002E37817B|nr:hypothetical protein [Francisella sp. 19X1-34]MED7787624.1 hypothetical protein [Francisella sp. 19X1-34]